VLVTKYYVIGVIKEDMFGAYITQEWLENIYKIVIGEGEVKRSYRKLSIIWEDSIKWVVKS
jgi:hypothetical protein